MTRGLILSGGIQHDFGESSDALAEALAELGIDVEISEDFDASLARLGEQRLVALNALRWQMSWEKYAAQRAQWQWRMPERHRAALAAFVRGGGALLALHTAALCFDDWPEWGDLLGAHWVWGESSHPPPADVRVRVHAGRHAIVAGLGDFTVRDEVYMRLALRDDVVPLLDAEAEGARHPLAWARAVGRGRVFYDALGHDGASLREPTHRRILQRAARWALGASDAQLGEA